MLTHAKIIKRAVVLFCLFTSAMIILKFLYLYKDDKCVTRTYNIKPEIRRVQKRLIPDSTKQFNLSSSKENTIAVSHVIYIITPTYRRETQLPDLTRLAQTLMNVPGIHWIVIEDATEKGKVVTDVLVRSGLDYTHLNVPSDKKNKSKIRGCSQRNVGLLWIRKKVKKGVIYFADDDNTYDIRLFEEIRNTQKVGLVPVGNFQYTGVSAPIVRNGQVVGFRDPWIDKRKFPLDMASMALSIPFWLKRGSPLFDGSRFGYMETRLLEALNVTMYDFEPKGQNGTMILAWHTRTQSPGKTFKQHTDLKKYSDTNLPKLLKDIVWGYQSCNLLCSYFRTHIA